MDLVCHWLTCQLLMHFNHVTMQAIAGPIANHYPNLCLKFIRGKVCIKLYHSLLPEAWPSLDSLTMGCVPRWMDFRMTGNRSDACTNSFLASSTPGLTCITYKIISSMMVWEVNNLQITLLKILNFKVAGCGCCTVLAQFGCRWEKKWGKQTER